MKLKKIQNRSQIFITVSGKVHAYRIFSFCFHNAANSSTQRHILSERRPSTAAWNSVRWWKIFCTGPTRAAKAEQKFLVPALQAWRTNQERTPFISTRWVSIHFSFNRRQGQAISNLSGITRNPTSKKCKIRANWRGKSFGAIISYPELVFSCETSN